MNFPLAKIIEYVEEINLDELIKCSTCFINMLNLVIFKKKSKIFLKKTLKIQKYLKFP